MEIKCYVNLLTLMASVFTFPTINCFLLAKRNFRKSVLFVNFEAVAQFQGVFRKIGIHLFYFFCVQVLYREFCTKNVLHERFQLVWFLRNSNLKQRQKFRQVVAYFWRFFAKATFFCFVCFCISNLRKISYKNAPIQKLLAIMVFAQIETEETPKKFFWYLCNFGVF